MTAIYVPTLLMTEMKRLLYTALTVMAILAALPAKAATDTYFPYPIVPDSIVTLQGRADFLVTHFWDFCDLKKGFSSRAKMAEAFSDYLSFMPHASAKNVHKSIAKLLKDLEKQPADQLFFAQKAEELIHSDTSEIFSDELFLPFARAVVENKRIPAKDKTHFIDQTKILTATMLGSRMPDIAYTDRNGNKAVFTPDSTQVTILFFNEPDNHECLLAKARLNADSKSSSFIADGIMKIVAITKTEPGEDWISFAKTMPETWTVGAVPDIDKIYDIRIIPGFYVIDQDGNILLKNANINQIISIISNL